MQDQYGSVAHDAITASERVFQSIVRVDWDRNGSFAHPMSNLDDWVESTSVDRSLTGSVPSEVALIEGASAAELTITLSGEHNGQSLTSIFSPFNETSPLYGLNVVGCEVYWDIGVEMATGRVFIRQFMGTIRTITPDRASNSVVITALDRVEQLRKPIQLSPWAVSDEHVNYDEINSQLAYSHWVIDNALRLCDVGPGPKRPTFFEEIGRPPGSWDGVQLYVTGNGSWIPTVGYLDNPNADTFPQDATPMYRANAAKHPNAPSDAPVQYGFAGLGTPVLQIYGDKTGQGIIRYWSNNQDIINPAATHYMGFTINTSGAAGNAVFGIADHPALEVVVGRGTILQVMLGNGQVWLRRYRWSGGTPQTTINSTKLNIPNGQNNVDIWVQWDNTSNTGGRCSLKAGANTTGWITFGGSQVLSTDTGVDQIKGRVTMGQAVNMSDIVYSAMNVFGDAANTTHNGYRQPKYAAALDIGLNRFSHTPNTRAIEAWKLITDVAAAEFGSVFWDENGVFRFWNLDRMLAKQETVVREFTLDEVSQLQVTNSLDSVRNVYSAQTRKRRAVYTGPIYKSADVNQFYVPGSSTRSFILFQDDVMSPLTFFMSKFSSDPTSGGSWPWGKWDADVFHGYGVQYLVGGLWQEINSRSGVDIRVYFTAEGYLRVSIYNGWTEPIRLAVGAGQDSRPAFNFAGTRIIEDATVSVLTKDQESIDDFGAQNLELNGDWVQDTWGTSDLIDKLVARTKRPIPTTESITVAGDPRLQLGDTILIHDDEGFGANLRYQIYGINRTLSRDTGLEDVLAIENIPSVTA